MTDLTELADAVISEYVLSGKHHDPRETFSALLEIADVEHVQQPWVWLSIAKAASDLGDTGLFLEFSKRFCFSPKTQRADFRIGKLATLIERVKALRNLGVDFKAELKEYLALSPSEVDVQQLTLASGLSGLEPDLDTFDDDFVFRVFDPVKPEATVPQPVAATHFAGVPADPIAVTIRAVHDVEFLSVGQDTAALRPGMSFYRHLSRSDTLRQARVRIGRDSKPLQLGGTAVVLNDLFTLSNYCHWMCDWFPRLLLALSNGPVDYVCVRMARTPFEMETLTEVAKIQESRLLATDMQNIDWYAFDKLVVVDNNAIAQTHPAWGGNPEVIKLVRQTVLDSAPVRPKRIRRKIYISRRRAGTRLVKNEDQLELMLSEFGIVTVQLEGISVREQARMFEESELVIGVHGAGLTNIMFMREGSNIIELFHYKFGSFAYSTLARGCAHRYTYMSCDSLPSSLAPERDKVPYKVTKYQYSDIWVDLDVLKGHLNQLGY